MIPANWTAFDFRPSADSPLRLTPLVRAHGDEVIIQQRLPEFQWHFQRIMREIGASIVDHHVRYVDLDATTGMRIVVNGATIAVDLYAQGGGEEFSYSREGFLVTFEDGTQRLYLFDFDGNNFDYVDVEGLSAGNRRMEGGGERSVYVSWDSTGGGCIAAEDWDKYAPNYYVRPYESLSGSLYSQGTEYPFVDGNIIGLGVSGLSVVVATYAGTTLVFHEGSIAVKDGNKEEVSAVAYGSVIGYCTLEDAVTVVNFNSDLSACTCGNSIIELPLPEARAPSTVCKVTRITIAPQYEIVWSGYDAADAVKFTLRHVKEGPNSYPVCPHSAGEYELGWTTDPANIVTKGAEQSEYRYYDLTYALNWDMPEETTRLGRYSASTMCTIYKKPIIIFTMGIYPTQAYAWMWTVSQATATTQNEFYWYIDYVTGEYVRCAWERDFFSTQQFDEYGIHDPVLEDVNHSTAISVNGQALLHNPSGQSNWFYTCANGRGDFILRKQPNSATSDALLVSKTGQMRTLNNTTRVDII